MQCSFLAHIAAIWAEKPVNKGLAFFKFRYRFPFGITAHLALNIFLRQFPLRLR